MIASVRLSLILLLGGILASNPASCAPTGPQLPAKSNLEPWPIPLHSNISLPANYTEADNTTPAIGVENDDGYFSMGGLSGSGGLNGLVGWLNPFGEGAMVVQIPHHTNLTFQHRQSAFPARLPIENALPLLSATLKPIAAFPALEGMTEADQEDVYGCRTPKNKKDLAAITTKGERPEEAIQSARYATSDSPLIALILRGRCSFSRKVINAQMRGASGVLIGDEELVYAGKSAAGGRGDEGDGGENRWEEGGKRESDQEGMKRNGLLTMYSPAEDTSKITIPSSFVSRSTYLRLRDIFATQATAGERVGLVVDLLPDEGFSWPVTDLVFLVMLLPSIMTIASILMNRYRMEQQRRAERAPPVAVLNLPERIWEPEEWIEKEDDKPTAPLDGLQTTFKSEPGSPTVAKEELHLGKPSSGFSPPFLAAPSRQNSSGPSQEASSSTAHLAHLLPLAEFRTSKLPVVEPIRPRPTAPKFKQTECAICLAEFERGDVVRVLPCSHLFHKEEVDAWLLGVKRICPVCRADIVTGNAAEDTTPVDDEADLGEARHGMLFEARRRIGSLGLHRPQWLSRWRRRPQEAGEVADETVPLIAGGV